MDSAFIQSPGTSGQNIANPISTSGTALPVVGSKTGLASTNPQANILTESAQQNAQSKLANQSTTTLSSNKTADIANIKSTTNNLADTGTKTDTGTGITTSANGSVYNPTPTITSTVTNPDGSVTNTYSDGTTKSVATDAKGNTTTGGYFQGTYYAPGSAVPKDGNGNPQVLTPTDPTDDAILAGLNKEIAQNDALTASLIANVQNSYQQLIQQQQRTNNSSQGSLEALLFKSGAAQNASGVGALQSQMSYGLSQISDLNNKEQNAILQAQQAGQNQDYQLQDKINADIQATRTEKQAAVSKLNDQVTAANQKLADQAFQTQQATTTAINGILADAAKNGVTDPATLAAIGNAKTVQDAITAAGNSLQVMSGDFQDYPEYRKDMLTQGLTPLNATDWLAQDKAKTEQQKISEAYGTAYAAAQAKAAVDKQNGLLNTQQQGLIDKTETRLAANPDVKNFDQVAAQYAVVNGIPDGTTNPTEQQNLLLAIAQIYVPGAKTVRGVISALKPSDLQSGLWNLLNNADRTIQAKGQLSADTVNQLKTQAKSIYNNNLSTYSSLRDEEVKTLEARGVPNADNYLTNLADVSANNDTTDYKSQVNDYVKANVGLKFSSGADVQSTVANAYKVPGATDQSVWEYIQLLNGK